mmetsp:Transcript_29864/g.84175  ORF Transcript_29864/g.84175 Transcript_29864/m.84175 type:complete len:290 (+) Transcript_29864:1593-2462(+)
MGDLPSWLPLMSLLVDWTSPMLPESSILISLMEWRTTSTALAVLDVQATLALLGLSLGRRMASTPRSLCVCFVKLSSMCPLKSRHCQCVVHQPAAAVGSAVVEAVAAATGAAAAVAATVDSPLPTTTDLPLAMVGRVLVVTACRQLLPLHTPSQPQHILCLRIPTAQEVAAMTADATGTRDVLAAAPAAAAGTGTGAVAAAGPGRAVRITAVFPQDVSLCVYPFAVLLTAAPQPLRLEKLASRLALPESRVKTVASVSVQASCICIQSAEASTILAWVDSRLWLLLQML